VSASNVLAELRAWSQFVGLQIEYSLLQRAPERDLVPMAQHFGLGVLSWGPLGAGVLTGKDTLGASAVKFDEVHLARLAPDGISGPGGSVLTTGAVTMSIGAIALDGCDAQGCARVWVGTGENGIRRDTWYGSGLFLPPAVDSRLLYRLLGCPHRSVLGPAGLRASCLPQASGSAPCSLVLGPRVVRRSNTRRVAWACARACARPPRAPRREAEAVRGARTPTSGHGAPAAGWEIAGCADAPGGARRRRKRRSPPSPRVK